MIKKFKVTSGPSVEEFAAAFFNRKEVSIATDRGTYTGKMLEMKYESEKHISLEIRPINGPKLVVVYDTTSKKFDYGYIDEQGPR